MDNLLKEDKLKEKDLKRNRDSKETKKNWQRRVNREIN